MASGWTRFAKMNLKRARKLFAFWRSTAFRPVKQLWLGRIAGQKRIGGFLALLKVLTTLILVTFTLVRLFIWFTVRLGKRQALPFLNSRSVTWRNSLPKLLRDWVFLFALYILLTTCILPTRADGLWAIMDILGGALTITVGCFTCFRVAQTMRSILS